MVLKWVLLRWRYSHSVYIYIIYIYMEHFVEEKQQCEKAPSSSSSSRVVFERRAIIPIIIAIIKNVIFVAALLTPPTPTKKKTSLYQKDPKRSSSEATSFLSAPNTLLLVCRRTPSDFCVRAQMIPLEKISQFDSNVHPYQCFFSDATIPLHRMSTKSEGQLESLSDGRMYRPTGTSQQSSPRAIEIPSFASTKPPSCGDCVRFWWWVSFLERHFANTKKIQAPLSMASFRRIGKCKKKSQSFQCSTPWKKKTWNPKKWEALKKLGGSFSIGWFLCLGSSRSFCRALAASNHSQKKTSSSSNQPCLLTGVSYVWHQPQRMPHNALY